MQEIERNLDVYVRRFVAAEESRRARGESWGNMEIWAELVRLRDEGGSWRDG